MNSRETVAYNIGRFLKLKGKSQVSLAQHVGLTKAAISNWVKGTTSPDLNNVISICEFLDISINDLFGHYDEKHLSVEEKIMLQEYRDGKFRDAINKLLDIN